jgi:hypothetical protein
MEGRKGTRVVAGRVRPFGKDAIRGNDKEDGNLPRFLGAIKPRRI